MEQDKNLPVEHSSKSLDPTIFFEKDGNFVYAFKKTEKLASAIYMVTSLFSENEPMKWSLRKKASDLISFVSSYKDTGGHRTTNFRYNLKGQILEIVSFLEVCSKGGLISNMNLSILRQEFLNIVYIFDAPQDKVIQSIEITSEHFQVEGNIKDRVPLTPIKDTDQIEEFKRSNRQNIILGMLKKKKELTIKDISQVIKDCSEKTIQRELISFISAGVIKRTGERRWSKYSLK